MSELKVTNDIKIGWSQKDLTPSGTVLISGQFSARISKGVMDPITVTAMVIDGQDQAVLVSCDFIGIPNNLRDEVRRRLKTQIDDLDPMKVIINATHTHEGPVLDDSVAQNVLEALGEYMPPITPVTEYLDFAAGRITDAVVEAWSSRTPASIAFGVGYAVVWRNRRWVNTDGVSRMYGDTNVENFSHIEGYEDHSVNLLAVRNENGELVGLVVNVPCPSQVTESLYVISADYWHETRVELRKRFGEKLFILPQCSAAGDQSPHLLFGKRETNRMLELSKRTERQEIAIRIADAVEKILQALKGHADSPLPMRHHVETLELEMNLLTEEHVAISLEEAKKDVEIYEQELAKIRNNSDFKKDPYWYVPITHAYRHMSWLKDVAVRFEKQKECSTMPTEFHVIRFGDMAFATNQFEYYLDFGLYIKARSVAVQNFLVQLAGAGTYVPSFRSVSGGGYGSVPASNPVGPKGGRYIAEKTVEVINKMWVEKKHV